MLHIVGDLTDQFIDFIKDDPVRPHIPRERRVSEAARIFVSTEQGQPRAITCVRLAPEVPQGEQDLFQPGPAVVAVFYTIWSYAPGAGRQLIFDSVDYIKQHYPQVRRFVTLSPKTDMAHRFHIRNGATVFRQNTDTVNYEYRSIAQSD
jgi:hypothetical protein